MRLHVDLDRCQGNGAAAAAPEFLALDEDGRVAVVAEEPGREQHKRVQAAARRCPTQAITVEG
jgi:ferredoxin